MKNAFSTTETTAGADLDTISTHVHSDLHRFFHGTTETDTALKLSGDTLGNEGGVKLRLLDFNNVDLGLFAASKTGNLAGHVLDFGTFTADHDTGTGGENGDTNAVPSTLNDDA